MSRKVKTISFSLVSEYDTRLLTYAEAKERGNFSQYVKRLIDADMRGVQQATLMYAPAQVHVEPKPADDDTDAMSSFLWLRADFVPIQIEKHADWLKRSCL